MHYNLDDDDDYYFIAIKAKPKNHFSLATVQEPDDDD